MTIKIRNLKLDFPGRLNLFVEELLIEEGRIFTIIGPNGAGKSTFLNIMALFQKPDNGTVEIWGENVLNLKNKLAFRRKISFLFSQPYLLNETVYNNIALPLRLRRLHDTKAVDEMLDLFKIGHLRAYRANTLSKGQMHRVALARAFVSRPKLLLLDEPFLSLDPRYKETLMSQLRSIIHAQGTTVIFITQDQVEALSLADDLAVMKDGRVLQQGNPEDIFTKPASKEVADFVGVETVIECVIIRKEDNLCFVKVRDKVLEVVSVCNEGDNVFVCIRPEDVVIAKHIDSSSARNHFKATIINIEPWRLEYKLSLDCGFNLVASVTAQSVKGLDLRIGQEIIASFKATAVHVIRRESQDDRI